MINLYIIWTVARCEARLLWRSWAFRLFSALALLALVFFNIVIIAPGSNAPHYLRSVSGHLPLFNLKVFNLCQGVIAALLAAEFIKRDRRLDTIQTTLVRSFTNLDYVLGKLLGLAFLFCGLQLLILGGVAAGHGLFADAPFAWQPYLLFPLVVTLPTLVFTVGLTWLLVSLLRNQALVFVCVLALSFLCFVLGQRFYYLVDVFAFFVPLTYSDFVGLDNLKQVLQVRSFHLLCGLSCVGLTALTLPRLRQSKAALVAALGLVFASGTGAASIGSTYLEQERTNMAYRQKLRTISDSAAALPTATITHCQLAVDRSGKELTVNARLTAVNNNGLALDSLLLCLNPGLKVIDAKTNGRPASPHRDQHLLWLKLQTPLAPQDSCRVELSYRGRLDPRFCYLDIDDERFASPYAFWLFRPPKAYAFVEAEYLHLTPESGWYPVAGLSPGAAFPKPSARDYYRFQVSATVPLGWTAFSQGAVVVDTSGQELTYHFTPQQPLAQVSLSAGPYQVRRLRVDQVDYALATLPNHDYFAAYFDSVGPVLPQTIRQLKNDYEAALGLEYPHPRLSLVEVPIQFFAYRRLWTLAQETVQPEILFLPEMGTLLEGADFKRMRQRANRSQERANQAESAEQVQADYLRTFARLDLLGLQDPGATDISQNSALEARWHLLPQYLSYTTHIASQRWPVLNYAFEAYFQERVTPPANTWNRQWRGLTETERANLVLQKHPLDQLLARAEATEAVDDRIRQTAIRAKGRQLLLLLAAANNPEDFAAALSEFAVGNRHRPIDEGRLLALLERLGTEAPKDLLNTWYRTPDLPGYQVESAEAYLVRDGERTRTQVEVALGNPTAVDGLVKLNFRFRHDALASWWERQRSGWDYSRVVPLPAGTSRRVGLLLDQPLAELIVDTYVARNIPSLIYFAFGEHTLRKSARPFSGFKDEVLISTAADSTERIVDNEDEGFELMSAHHTSRLRRFLLDLFDQKDKAETYVGLRSWEPPGTWQATTDHRLYGRFVRSSYYKEGGGGRSRVAWKTPISEEGNYDIYFYCGPIKDLQNRKRGAKGQQAVHFLVYHEDGVDDLTLDQPDLQRGWNHLGTYHLAAGPARVELTDRSTSRIVVADAVKWVRQ